MSLIIKMDHIDSESHLTRAIHYVMQEWKTEGCSYSNCGLSPDEVAKMFFITKENFPRPGNRQGYHFKFSFSKDESISKEDAFSFVKEWAAAYLGEDYDYVAATHCDRDHMHMHLVFNSVSREGRKYHYAKTDWDKVITPLTNRLAEKYHTGPLKKKDENLQKISERKQKIQEDMDAAKKESRSYEDFKRILQQKYGYYLREGVSQKHGVYWALTPPGQQKAVRTYQLEPGYMPADIRQALEEKNLIDERGINGLPEYRRLFIQKDVWFVGKRSKFIPYEELSIYQQYQVRRMLEARRLYQGLHASMQMRERSESALQQFDYRASLVCNYNIRSEKEGIELMNLLKKEAAFARHKMTYGTDQQKKEGQATLQLLKKALRQIKNLLKPDTKEPIKIQDKEKKNNGIER